MPMTTARSFLNRLYRPACRLFLICLLPVATAMAQDYPARAVTLVVPYPPGSATDIVARLLQPKLAQALKQNVIVENRGGASTNIGTEFVSRAAPDGYTVLIQAPNIVTNEFAFSTLRWKREDFAPVALLARWSNVLLAGPSAQARDVKQLLASGKATSAGYNYGSPGPGSLSHLAVEMLKQRSDIGMQHVTFTGPAPMITSLLGGHIQYMVHVFSTSHAARFASAVGSVGFVGTSEGKIRDPAVYSSLGNGASYAATTAGSSGFVTHAASTIFPMFQLEEVWLYCCHFKKASVGGLSPVGKPVLATTMREKRSGSAVTTRSPTKPPQS
jgi:hypothetical protein